MSWLRKVSINAATQPTMSYKLLKITTALIIALEVILNPQLANASTTVDYSSPCKYFDASGKLQFSGTCSVNFGTLGVQGGARFIVTFPNSAEVTIYNDGQEAFANHASADVAVAGDNVVVATVEGEIFIFKTYE